MGIKETIQKRAKQAAKQYKENFFKKQRGKYEETITEYEELLTQYYKQEIEINFLTVMQDQHPDREKNEKIEKLKQEHILLLKKVKDIENAGILEKYDAVMAAIKGMDENP